MPPVSAAPTWPKNLRRLALLAALLVEGFPVSITSATVFFLFIIFSGLLVRRVSQRHFRGFNDYRGSFRHTAWIAFLFCINLHIKAASFDKFPDVFPPLVRLPTAFISSAVISGSIEQLSRVNYK